METSTQFFIDLLSNADKLAKFNSGACKTEMATNRRNMLAEAGITDVDELIELAPEEVYKLLIDRFSEQIRNYKEQKERLWIQKEAAQNGQQAHDQADTICSMIARQALARPDQVAIVDGEITVGYLQLMHRADAIAHELAERGVAAGSLVCVCMSRSWELAATLLGVLQAGCAYVPVDPAYPRDRVRYMLGHSRAAAAIVDAEQCADLCKGVPELIWLDQVSHPTAKGLARPTAKDLAYVIYTSGSTGQPKGVAIEHRNVVAMAQAMGQLLKGEELEGVLAATSVCFDPSVMEIFGTLALGGTVILAKDVLELPALSASKQVKSCIMVPSAMQALLSSGWIPNGIRCMVFGGEVLKRPLIDKLFALTSGTRIINVYGPTEDTVFSTAIEIVEDTPTITIGKSVPGSAAYVLDHGLNPVPDGEAGELYLAGNKLARGYLHDEVRTRERFIELASGAAIPEQRLYRTGDLCRKTDSGEIEFLGRVDQQVKIRGFRIELEEIEAVLESMPGITAAAVAAVEGGIGQKMLAAYVVPHDNAVTDESIKAYVAQQLPRYMVPQVVIHLDQLPLLPNGKLDRNALQRFKAARVLEQAQPVPESGCGNIHKSDNPLPYQADEAAGNAASILPIIQREVAFLLDHEDPEEIRPDHSFDNLGLDSLSTLEFSCRLSKILNKNVPVEAICQHGTPQDLARYIQNNSTVEEPSAESSKAASDTLGTFQAQIQSSHPTFQAAKAAAWSATDKGILVQELMRMVNDLRRNPYSKVLRTGSGTRGTVADAYNDEAREAIIWTTNLYLGLNRDQTVIEEATKALQQFGTGMGTSAAASGITDLHLQFEKEFAELVGKPGACVFPTGYTANVGVVAGLLGKNDVVVIDQLCHASIVDGARLCGATIRTFQHNNSSDLESILKAETSPYRTVLVVLEGVYSMGEGAAPVADVVRTAKKYGALVLVDEAHSFGFYGEKGAGICAAQGISEEVDFIMTTLSKALGSLGGVVAARKEHIDLLKSSAKAYIFQASVSPADMAAALTSLRRLRSDDSLRERLWDTTRYMRRQFTEAGFDLGKGDGPIVTPHFSDKDKLYAIVQGMYKRGIQTSAVTYPIVESGRGRLRLICSAAHTREDVDKTLAALVEAEREADEQLSEERTSSEVLDTTQPDVQEWAHAFSAYLSRSVADALHPAPELAMHVYFTDPAVPITIEVKGRDVSLSTAAHSEHPSCTLFLTTHEAASALCTSNIQALLHCISKGTCVLKGQIEPFIWLFARMVGQQREAYPRE